MTIFQNRMNNPWIFEADQFRLTPSIRDGIAGSLEFRRKWDAVKFIQKLGNDLLNLHYSTVATGAIFFHRFYMFHSLKMFPEYPMAATCLFLAGKVEETPKKSNDIIRFAKQSLSEEHFAQFGTDPKEEMLTLERILLQTLRFDLEVEHPYPHLVEYKKHLKLAQHIQEDPPLPPNTVLLQAAWTFLNDSYCGTVSLRYDPEIVAIATIFLGCKTKFITVVDWDNRKLDHENWWDAYVDNVDEKILEDVCHVILDVYPG